MPIVGELYCLTCGYNLRGLSGDPVRCPECGELNDLGSVHIPANLIKRALLNMETAPTLCTACALATIILVALLTMTPWKSSVGTVSLPVALAFLWWMSPSFARTVFGAKQGRRASILHLTITLALCTVCIHIGRRAFVLRECVPWADGAGVS